MIRKIAQLPIHLYRKLSFLRIFFTTQHGGPCCRYHPTCSKYALQAIEKHGILGGTYLTINRLLRCHPWAKSFGEDPVPEKIALNIRKIIKREDTV
ncbi:MAG: membrane protein insertion efficiency factor YidD [Micavibrio sp.]|nr:membrane protein insertion efficiency factor YidD [Micavibrio sp.]|tara:strand:- start:7398 stop:7685 length:288 start_codon:yes stop_codon:yes gene_type:complete